MTRKQWFEKMDNDFDADLSRLRRENEAMREAIVVWDLRPHRSSFYVYDGCPAIVGHPCTCGAEQANAARAAARKAAGLED